ncbi:hypothetical protein HMPREF1092_03200 [Clostridium thermobutyricum]|uniref:Uncharacterized protein n=1 Tax=Clostridium thermobutyricum TaxID=29372 RepID=N9W986_9CLOT|nr:hypothetical protein [Clostridium thermobutyricum]ENY99459.1 hypothetical protein HMPREF1092_03200 [Clostridium thermobutyricum]
MHFIGYRYVLMKETKEILDRIVFIHNGAFLNYKYNNTEKQEALELLENIARKLGTSLEKYKIKQITTSEMYNIYTVCKENCKDIIITYPWLCRFDLNSGCGVNYHNYLKSIKKIKYDYFKDKLIK